MVGGEQARRAIYQCDRLGFDGKIWPVNPNRDEMESRPCFSSLQELPSVPDAAFVAIPGAPTVEAVAYLASVGAGGAVCYASGFAEAGDEGKKLQLELETRMGAMPVIGPNCYGVLNYQDGVALWPDEQGGRRCDQGVAIISQSGNISVSLTMQRRGVPIAYLISTGNMAGVKTHDYIYAMLDNPDITAIGLYLEAIPDAQALSEAAIAALNRNIPVVVLEAGLSETGASVTLSHSHSMTGNRELNSAFYSKYGIIQVHSIPQLLETLKFCSVLTPVEDRTIATISCSGGEAALMADLAEKFDLTFPEFSAEQQKRLHDVLGDRVVISNPLDYHTYIWGKQQAQKECFQAVFEGKQALTVKAFDFPTEGLCDTREWDYAVQAIVDAKTESEARVAVMSTLHENLPLGVQELLLSHGIAPMLGMQECLQAISDSSKFASYCANATSIQPLDAIKRTTGRITTFTEHQGKQELSRAGISVVQGRLAKNAEEAIHAANQLGYPVVAKASSPELVHKTESDGVILDINSEDELRVAVGTLSALTGEYLIERMAPTPLLELLVGIRNDERFGLVMVVGAGGRLAELLHDSATLMFPVTDTEIRKALEILKIGKILNSYRGLTGDIEAVTNTLVSLTEFASDYKHQFDELEVNPLFVYRAGEGVLAVDVLLRLSHDL